MCLIVFAYKVHVDYPLILLANRDEFYDRPTRSAAFWPEAPSLLAGRDLKQGGTWLGLTRQGRIATVTNFRNPRAPVGLRSRGTLVTNFLSNPQVEPQRYLDSVQRYQDEFSGFNLLVGDLQRLFYLSNRSPESAPVELKPGIYGISNHFLDSPWPKLERAKTMLQGSLTSGRLAPEQLLAILQDDHQPQDQDLPDTGIGLADERLLSSIFIKSARYGTRASTVITLAASHAAEFLEQNYGPHGVATERKEFSFQLQQPL